MHNFTILLTLVILLTFFGADARVTFDGQKRDAENNTILSTVPLVGPLVGPLAGGIVDSRGNPIGGGFSNARMGSRKSNPSKD
ncbi:uncharacterized protein EV154DRAFT_496753, partial [Mucor mucedo]|uniref:uncharacterized protein n=1 Tax=Mucor mucedo TaxID=29922 RepID=UPI00221EE8FD